MPSPKIPSCSDSENNVFHPVFKYALEQVIAEKGIDDVEVVNQFQTLTGPVDLVLRRVSTGRVILPIEIKRTKSAVRGIGRRQARDYQLNLTLLSETPFYCVSNLELTELFNADAQRSTTLSQKIKLETVQDAQLDRGRDEEVIPTLKRVLGEILDIVFGKKRFQYEATLNEFSKSLELNRLSVDDWHRTMLPFCFEYLRGNRSLHDFTAAWRPALAYKETPRRIVDLGNDLNYDKIFTEPRPVSGNFGRAILEEAYKAGQAFGDGDDVSSIIGDILFDPKMGIVETDYDLAKLLAVVMHSNVGELGRDDVLLDPCAGSGKLMSALIHSAYRNVDPRKVMLVEKEKLFAETLCLRIGLHFGREIPEGKIPSVYLNPLEVLDKNLFTDVKAVVVNPPYISGVSAAAEKRAFIERIREISGRESRFKDGQIGLEALFVELLYELLPNGAVVGLIIPGQIMSRLSDDFKSFRAFLLNDMGLTDIVCYPSTGVFEKVMKNTFICVCRKASRAENIRLIDVQFQVPDVDLKSLESTLGNPEHRCYGVEVENVPRAELVVGIETGWKTCFGPAKNAARFSQATFARLLSIDAAGLNVRRGTLGNCGNTELTVRLPGDRIGVPEAWQVLAVNKAIGVPKHVTGRNCPNISFIPPPKAYVEGSLENRALMRIINRYLRTKSETSKKQKVKVKTPEDVVRDLSKDQRNPADNAFLVPRAAREEAKIVMIGGAPTLVSTNFLICSTDCHRTTKLYASWIQSVYGQLQLELGATSERGMRKVEIVVLNNVKFPDLTNLDETDASRLIALLSEEDFLRIDNVEPRESDRIWAKCLVGDRRADDNLRECQRILMRLYEDRSN